MENLAVTGITGKSGIWFLKETLRNEDDFLEQWGYPLLSQETR